MLSYPVVIFDALRVKIRDKDSRIVRNKAVYLALGITGDGTREVLGLWIAENEGAKFWLSVMTELRNRGVQDILIAVVDGLKGFPEAITAAFPQTTVQTCIVHLVRHSLNFCSWKDRKAVAARLARGLWRRDRRSGPGRARGLRCRVGAPVSLDRPGLAPGLGGGDPVLCLQPGDPPRDLHHKRRGKASTGVIRKAIKTRGSFPIGGGG